MMYFRPHPTSIFIASVEGNPADATQSHIIDVKAGCVNPLYELYCHSCRTTHVKNVADLVMKISLHLSFYKGAVVPIMISYPKLNFRAYSIVNKGKESELCLATKLDWYGERELMVGICFQQHYTLKLLSITQSPLNGLKVIEN